MCDVKQSITKPEIVDILVGVRRVLVMILKHPLVKVGILPLDRLDSYIWLMEDSWDYDREDGGQEQQGNETGGG